MASAASVAVYSAVLAATSSPPNNPTDVAQLKHHVNGGKSFTNPWPSFVDADAFKVSKAMLTLYLKGDMKKVDTTPPTVPVIPAKFLPSRETAELRATWLGHACFFVEFPGGLRVLFDPVFEPCCGPYGWLGPKRYNEPPCKLEDIPIVDAVVISHNHYDHLSHPSLQKIKDLHPNVQFFAPLGNKDWFLKSGFNNMTELDWWEAKELTLTKTEENEADDNAGPKVITATISCLPSQHMSARTPFDRMKTLWASWSVESGGKKVWFGGDTGYRTVPEVPKGEDDYGEKYKDLPRCPAFAEIGSLRGPFDLGLIPIGAYYPRHIFSTMHADPFDAVNIFIDSQCKKALGIHWGTWVLTFEDVLDPPKLLKEALKKHGIEETGVFDVCDIGESREF